MGVKASPPATRLAGKYEVNTTTGCWEWVRMLDHYGYGVITELGHPRRAHRVAYEHFVGPIPAGLVIDHLCRNTRCINPAHMEPVTQAENVRRGQAPNVLMGLANRCKQGHDLTIYGRKRKSAPGQQCGLCSRQRGVARYYRLKAAGIDPNAQRAAAARKNMK